MKFYSENLNKLFDSEKALVDAETEAKRAAEEKEAKAKALTEARKDRAKEIDVARDEMIAAEKKYHDLINKFVTDYGSYHRSYVKNNLDDDFGIMFDSLFRLF